MIERKVFGSALKALAATFPNVVLTPENVIAYYQLLAPRLTAAELVAACEALALSERQFFPRPGEILAAAQGSAEAEGLREWAVITDPGSWEWCSGHSVLKGSVLAALSPRASFALRVLGGTSRIGNADDRETDFLRKEFLAAYRTMTDEERAGRGPERVTDGRRADATIDSVIESVKRRAVAG